MSDAQTIRRLPDWRQYIIYLGFVAVFVFFAVTLGLKGFLDANNLLTESVVG